LIDRFVACYAHISVWQAGSRNEQQEETHARASSPPIAPHSHHRGCCGCGKHSSTAGGVTVTSGVLCSIFHTVITTPRALKQ